MFVLILVLILKCHLGLGATQTHQAKSLHPTRRAVSTIHRQWRSNDWRCRTPVSVYENRENLTRDSLPYAGNRGRRKNFQ